MDLKEFTGGTKDTKPWLTIVAKSVTAETVTADNFVGPIVGNEVTLNEQASVPDPAPGKVTLFANLSGQVSTTNSVGDTITLLDNPASQDQDMNSHNVINVLNLAGPTNSRLADNIVSNSAPVSSTSNVPVFSDGSGLVIQDSHVNIGHVVTNNAAVAVDGNLASFNGTSGIAIHDSGVSAASITGGPFLPTAGGTMGGDLGMGGHNIVNAGSLVPAAGPSVVVTNLVSNGGASVNGNLASFNGSSGKVVQDSGIAPLSVAKSSYSLAASQPFTLSNFTALTSVLTSAAHLGSLTFPPNSTRSGTVFRFSAEIQIHIKNGSSITFALVSGIPFGPSVTNSSGSDQGPTGITWTGEMVIYTGGFAVLNSFYGTDWNGAVAVSNGGPAGGFWANDFTGTNSLDLQVGFSLADPGNNVTCNSFSVMQLF